MVVAPAVLAASEQLSWLCPLLAQCQQPSVFTSSSSAALSRSLLLLPPWHEKQYVWHLQKSKESQLGTPTTMLPSAKWVG